MIPAVGTVALYTFSAPFAALNGVYTLVKTMTFETALAAGVDFVASLYTPAGRTAADYTSEASSFAHQITLQLEGVGESASTIYYAPLGVIAQVPDPTVKRYADIYLSIHIGAFADETVYTWIATQINDLMASVTGNTDTAQFYADDADDVYLTQSQYQALATARAANIVKINPLIVQNQALQAQLQDLQTKLNVYENFLKQAYTTNQILQATIANVRTGLPAFGSRATVSM